MPDLVQPTSTISCSTSSSTPLRHWRMSLKSVRKYRSRLRTAKAGRPLQSNRSHGSGISRANVQGMLLASGRAGASTAHGAHLILLQAFTWA